MLSQPLSPKSRSLATNVPDDRQEAQAGCPDRVSSPGQRYGPLDGYWNDGYNLGLRGEVGGGTEVFMNVIRRPAGSVVILLASVVFVVCFAGITGVWIVKSRVDALGGKVFDAADESLAFMDVKLERIEGAFKNGHKRIGLLARGVDRLSEKGAEVKARATSLLETLDNEVLEPLKSAQSWLNSTYAVAVGVGKVSEAVVSSKYAASHEDAMGVAMARQLQDASENVVEILTNLKEVRQRLADIRDGVRSTRRIAAMIVARLSQVEKRMANLCERMQRFHARVVALKGEVAAAKNSFHWWTILGAVLATSLLAWLAVSQISMVLHGWSLAKGQAR